jgi:tRNA pseudouridine65 synthase
VSAPRDIAILYADEALVAVDKPPGLLVHRSGLADGENDVLVDRVRRTTGRLLFPIHRLDRATSGIVLFAADRQLAGALGAEFMARRVDKRYLAVCRGWPEPEGLIDHALDAPGMPEKKPARTAWTRLATAELPIAVGRYPSVRLALIEARPETGRYRQIRRHFKHLSHHLIGDTSHGDGRHNRFARMHLGAHRLLLHAWGIRLAHPATGLPIAISAPPDADFRRALERLGWLTFADAGPDFGPEPSADPPCSSNGGRSRGQG